MPKYTVRVWIDDIEVEADTAWQAENKVLDLVTDGDISVRAEYAEAQTTFRDGEWQYVKKEEREELL